MKPLIVLIVVLLLLPMAALAQSATIVDAQHLIEPADLAKQLLTSKPLVLQVGPRTLYAQAHIPGAEFIGGTSQPEGLKALHDRVQKVPKNKLIVIYCGCCPWERCPNVAPAYNELKTLGFTKFKVLHIPQNFGADWVMKGYPVEKGEPGTSQGK